MSIFAHPRFLSRVMGADAVSCAATGALQLAFSGAMAGLTGLDAGLLAGTGAFLLAYAALAAWMALRAQPPRLLVGLVIAGNIGWALGCVALMASGILPLSALGLAWVGAQAVVVAVLAELQFAGLRATRAGQRAALA